MDSLEGRLRVVETEQAVMGTRVSALEGWRRFDEPRVAGLVKDDELADKVRAALADRSQRGWNVGQKLGAGLVGAAIFGASLAEIVTLVRGWFG